MVTDPGRRALGRAKLPGQLRFCDECGEVRGASGGVKSWCLCEGQSICKTCGVHRIQPGSNYYDWRDGSWWHVFHLGGLLPCRACRHGRSVSV